MAGLFLGLASFLPVLTEPVASEDAVGRYWFFSVPEISLFCAVLSSVIGWMVFSKLVKEGGYSPIFINGFSMFSGGILALGTSCLFEQGIHVTAMVPFLWYVGLIILISNIISYNLYGTLLKHYTATFLFFAGSISPVFAATYDWLWFGRIVSLPFVISTVFTAFGLYIFYQNELKEGYLKK